MKIDLGGGVYLEADQPPRRSPFHRAILRTERIPHTRRGYTVDLDCGHRAVVFGNLAQAGGRVFCTQCRDAAEPPLPLRSER